MGLDCMVPAIDVKKTRCSRLDLSDPRRKKHAAEESDHPDKNDGPRENVTVEGVETRPGPNRDAGRKHARDPLPAAVFLDRRHLVAGQRVNATELRSSGGDKNELVMMRECSVAEALQQFAAELDRLHFGGKTEPPQE